MQTLYFFPLIPKRQTTFSLAFVCLSSILNLFLCRWYWFLFLFLCHIHVYILTRQQTGRYSMCSYQFPNEMTIYDGFGNIFSKMVSLLAASVIEISLWHRRKKEMPEKVFFSSSLARFLFVRSFFLCDFNKVCCFFLFTLSRQCRSMYFHVTFDSYSHSPPIEMIIIIAFLSNSFHGHNDSIRSHFSARSSKEHNVQTRRNWNSSFYESRKLCDHFPPSRVSYFLYFYFDFDTVSALSLFDIKSNDKQILTPFICASSFALKLSACVASSLCQLILTDLFRCLLNSSNCRTKEKEVATKSKSGSENEIERPQKKKCSELVDKDEPQIELLDKRQSSFRQSEITNELK